MRISDWSSDVCSSDLVAAVARNIVQPGAMAELRRDPARRRARRNADAIVLAKEDQRHGRTLIRRPRSEEHTSELQSLMRISYAVFCLKKKKTTDPPTPTHNQNQQQ